MVLCVPFGTSVTSACCSVPASLVVMGFPVLVASVSGSNDFLELVLRGDFIDIGCLVRRELGDLQLCSDTGQLKETAASRIVTLRMVKL